MTRACGECSACCTSLSVPSLSKAANVRCPHLADGGCAIYGEHPWECKRFACAWLDCPPEHRNLIRDNERPDVCGLVLTFIGDTVDFEDFIRRFGYPPLQAFEVWPGAADQYKGQRLLERLRRKALIVVCRADGGRSVIGPKGYNPKVLARLTSIAERNAAEEKEAYT